MEKKKRIYVPKELYEKLEFFAKMMGVSVGEYIETLVTAQRIRMCLEEP